MLVLTSSRKYDVCLWPDLSLEPMEISIDTDLSRIRTNWIEKLPAPIAEDIRAKMSTVELQTNQVLYHKGDPISHIYEMVSGKIKLSLFSENGREMIFTILGPPITFADITAMGSDKHLYTAASIEPAVVRQLSVSKLNRLRQQYPEINDMLLRSASRRLVLSFKNLENSFFFNIETRMAKRLHSIALLAGSELTDDQGNRYYSVRLKQDQLAAMLGTTRQSVNRVLRDWETKGWIKLNYGKIEIYSISALAEMVDKEGL